MSADASLSLNDRFEVAAEKARKTSVSSKTTQQELYGLYKQATVGKMPADQARPGWLDPTGRAKYDGWKAVEDLPKDEAMEKYIALVDSL